MRSCCRMVGTSRVPDGAWNGAGWVAASANGLRQATFRYSALTMTAAVVGVIVPRCNSSLIRPWVVFSTSALIVPRDPSGSPEVGGVQGSAGPVEHLLPVGVAELQAEAYPDGVGDGGGSVVQPGRRRKRAAELDEISAGGKRSRQLVVRPAARARRGQSQGRRDRVRRPGQVAVGGQLIVQC